MREIWKPIEGLAGYEVSSLGRIRSYKCRHRKENRRVNKK